MVLAAGPEVMGYGSARSAAAAWRTVQWQRLAAGRHSWACCGFIHRTAALPADGTWEAIDVTPYDQAAAGADH